MRGRERAPPAFNKSRVGHNARQLAVRLGRRPVRLTNSERL